MKFIVICMIKSFITENRIMSLLMDTKNPYLDTEFNDRKTINVVLSWYQKNPQNSNLDVAGELGSVNYRIRQQFIHNIKSEPSIQWYEIDKLYHFVDGPEKSDSNKYDNQNYNIPEEKVKFQQHCRTKSSYWNIFKYHFCRMIFDNTVLSFMDTESSLLSDVFQFYTTFLGTEKFLTIKEMLKAYFSKLASNPVAYEVIFVTLYCAICTYFSVIRKAQETNTDFQVDKSKTICMNEKINSNTNRKYLKQLVRNECEDTAEQDKSSEVVLYDACIDRISYEADRKVDIQCIQYNQLQVPPKTKINGMPVISNVFPNLLCHLKRSPKCDVNFFQDIFMCKSINEYLCNSFCDRCPKSSKFTSERVESCKCVIQENSETKRLKRLFHTKNLVLTDRLCCNSVRRNMTSTMCISEVMCVKTDIEKMVMKIYIQTDLFLDLIRSIYIKFLSQNQVTGYSYVHSCLRSSVMSPFFTDNIHNDETVGYIIKKIVKEMAERHSRLSENKTVYSINDTTLKDTEQNKVLSCKIHKPGDFKEIHSDGYFQYRFEGERTIDTVEDTSASEVLNLEKSSENKYSVENLSNDQIPSVEKAWEKIAENHKIETLTKTDLLFPVKLSKQTENDTEQGCFSDDCLSESHKAVLPKLLEIRGTEQERKRLIRELSTHFFSKQQSNRNTDNVHSQISGSKSKEMSLDQDLSDTECEKEKERTPWHLRWRIESFQQNRKPFFVYPISPYFHRIATFANWPKESPISAIKLSKAGFYYKGEGQFVECFSCKLQIGDWKIGDVPMEIHNKLSPHCSFLQGKDEISENSNFACSLDGNSENLQFTDKTSVDISEDGIAGATGFQSDLPEHFRSALTLTEQSNPIVSQTLPGLSGDLETGISENQPDSTTLKNPVYESIQARLESFRAWSFHDKQSPRSLVDAGFYYLGKDDIVRCFCCDIGLAEWDTDDDPWVEHARHSPECSYVKRERGEAFINSIQESWRQIYSPKHPHLADYHIRLETFTAWPEYIEQRPPALCQAGFFFTGEEDVVRCHYCDGGLRQWESGDDPWIEHARWFPFCKYIVKIKGMAFIEDVARRYNEIYSSNETVNQISKNFAEMRQKLLVCPYDALNVEEQLIDTDYRTDYQRENISRTENLLQEPQSADSVRYVLAQGYSLQNVMMAIQQFSQFNRRRNFTASDLIDIIAERERIGDLVPDNNMTPFVGRHAVDNQPSKALAAVVSPQRSDIEKLDDKQLAVVNTQLKNQLMCSSCHIRENEIVFTPCGHRVTCEECSSNTERCPKCDKRIENRIKTFLA